MLSIFLGKSIGRFIVHCEWNIIKTITKADPTIQEPLYARKPFENAPDRRCSCQEWSFFYGNCFIIQSAGSKNNFLSERQDLIDTLSWWETFENISVAGNTLVETPYSTDSSTNKSDRRIQCQEVSFFNKITSFWWKSIDLLNCNQFDASDLRSDFYERGTHYYVLFRRKCWISKLLYAPLTHK